VLTPCKMVVAAPASDYSQWSTAADRVVVREGEGPYERSVVNV
jgi:hypothetical protein